MVQNDQTYVSYLMQFRFVQRDDARMWIASLRSTATGEVQTFRSVSALAEFLCTEFDERQTPVQAVPQESMDGHPEV